MEDDAAGCLSLPNHPDMIYAGVFDGHAGPKASRFVPFTFIINLFSPRTHTSTRWFSKRLHTYIDKMKYFSAQEFVETCISADSEFLKTNTAHDDGTTAVFLLLEPMRNSKTKQYQLTVANIGDSRSAVTFFLI